MKISAVYKITNTITNDFYIGSSKNVKRRWNEHKRPSTWNKCPNNPLYKDMKKYGTDKFSFQILEEVESEELKVAEQQFIEILKPTYNQMNAKGLDVERRKEYHIEYYQQNREKRIDYQIEYYQQNRDKYKEYQIEYQKSNKYKEYQQSEKRKEYMKEYRNQLCSYNGETITLDALRTRFRRSGIEHPTIEARKYIIKK